MKWNISVIEGIKTNKDSVSTGEGKWNISSFLLLAYNFFLLFKNLIICDTKEGNSPVLEKEKNYWVKYFMFKIVWR